MLIGKAVEQNLTRVVNRVGCSPHFKVIYPRGKFVPVNLEIVAHHLATKHLLTIGFQQLV